MRHSNSQITRLMCLAVLTVFLFSGCRSGIFKKSEMNWKRPDMAGLAFWKKGDAKSVPPPPAHHFDPAPPTGAMMTASTINTDAIKSAAKFKPNTKSKSAEPDLQSKFNQLVDAAKKDQGTDAEAIAEISGLSDGSTTKPIRSPYSLSDTKNSVASVGNSAAKNVQNSFDPAALKAPVAAVDDTIEKAQSDFKAALASSSNSIKNSVSASSAAASELAQQGANDFQNDFQLPKKIEVAQNKIASTLNQFEASSQNVNHSLYDLTGNLANGAKNGTTDASKKIVDNLMKANPLSVDSDAQTGLDHSVVAQTNQFRTDSVGISNEAKSLPTEVAESVELTKVRSEVELAQLQIAELQKQIELAKQNAAVKVSAAEKALSQQNVPPAAQASVNLNVPNTALNMAVNAANQPIERIAQANFHHSSSTTYSSNENGNFSPLQSGSMNSNATTAVSPTSNMLRSGAQFAGGSSENNAFNNSFGGSSSNAFEVQPVGLQSPISASSGSNHVSEIDIPPTVLQGSSSYAPGSVHRLIPNK